MNPTKPRSAPRQAANGAAAFEADADRQRGAWLIHGRKVSA